MLHGSCCDTETGARCLFPAYNDSGTIASLVITSLKTAARLTPDFEIIIVNDGSADATAEIADELARTYRQVRVVHHEKNRGRRRAAKRIRRRDPRPDLLHGRRCAVRSVGNGSAVGRLQRRRRSGQRLQDQPIDPLHRILIGRIYHHTVKMLFGLKVRDVDCDFRLMRRAIFDRVSLEKDSGVICLEMMKKIQDAGYRISEVPVHHYHRVRQIAVLQFPAALSYPGIDVMKLWLALVVRGEHRRAEAANHSPAAVPPRSGDRV